MAAAAAAAGPGQAGRGRELVSLTGDWLLAVGLTYAVYDLTGSTMASAGVFLTSLLPQVLVGLVAGVLVDRWDRRGP